MMVSPALIVGWILFAVVVVAVILLSYAFVKYFQDSYESSPLLTVISVVCISLSFCLLMVVPVDVLTTTVTFDMSSSSRNTLVEALYFAMFLAMIILIFLVVPFAFFFFEEGTEAPLGRRVLSGLKYTTAFVVVFIIIVVLGFVLRGTLDPGGLGPYGEHLLTSLNSVEAAVDFMVACTALVGLLVWFTYTAFGFSWLGISFLKRRPMDSIAEQEDLDREIIVAREQRKHLRTKILSGRTYGSLSSSSGAGGGGGRNVEQVGLLQRKERVLRLRQEKLGRIGTCYRSCMMVLRPVTIIVGIVLLLIMTFVVLSLLLTSIDKLSPNALGHVLGNVAIFNPIDWLLSVCMPFFPLDYVIFTIVVLFLWFATISGLSRAGVRFLWIELFQIRRQRTAPQGVLLVGLLMMLVCITLMFMLDTLAPRYMLFGSQTYIANSTLTQCTIFAPPEANCTMTEIERIVTDVKFRFSFFAVVFYWSQWAFLAFFLAGLIFSIFLKVRGSKRDVEDEDYD